MKTLTRLLVLLFWLIVAGALVAIALGVFGPLVSAQPPAPAPQTQPAKPAPKDPVNTYLTLYDTNHDGRLDVQELKRMAVLDPAAYKIASAFVDHSGNLGVDQISQWRSFLQTAKK